MPNPTLGDVHINRPLGNISVAYQQEETAFVASQVFPNIPVDHKSDDFRTWDRQAWSRTETQERAPATESVGTGWKTGTDSYSARVYALHVDVDDQTRANSDSDLQVDRQATRLVTRQNLIKKEKLWADAFFKTGVWGRDVTGVSAGPAANQFLQWNDAASDPVMDVKKEIIRFQEATGYTPNTIVASPHVEMWLLEHADVVDRVKYVRDTISLARNVLAQLFGVQRFLVPTAIADTAAEGAAFNPTFIYSKGLWLGYVTPEPGLLVPSAGYTFSWRGYLGASAFGTRIKKFRLEAIASDRVEGEMAFDLKKVAGDLGVFFASAVA
jgi:hypothetical protein